MPRRVNESLFADEPADEATPDTSAPLAERVRPRTLAEFVGQQHLVGEGRVLRRVIEGGGLLPSLILWGAGHWQDDARATPRAAQRLALRAALGGLLRRQRF